MTFKFDEDALRKAAEELVHQHQEEFNVELRKVVREVRDEMGGQPADQVYDELVSRLRAKFDTFEPDDAGLREVAESIEKRELTE